MRLVMAACVICNFAAFAVACWLSFRFWRWVYSFFGPLQPLALALTAAYIAASFWAYSHPVDALALHGVGRPTKLLSPGGAGVQDGAAAAAPKKEL